MATTLACSLNSKKDKELITFIEDMNNQGYNNSVLLKVALYNFMKTTKMQYKAIEEGIKNTSVGQETVTTGVATTQDKQTDEEIENKEELSNVVEHINKNNEREIHIAKTETKEVNEHTKTEEKVVNNDNNTKNINDIKDVNIVDNANIVNNINKAQSLPDSFMNKFKTTIDLDTEV